MLWLLLGNFGKIGLLFIPSSGHTASNVLNSFRDVIIAKFAINSMVDRIIKCLDKTLVL